MVESSNQKTLPSRWMHRLFNVMQGHYGSRWLNMWKIGQDLPEGQDAGVVNAMYHWGEKLGVFTEKPECIKWALDHLPANPPTLTEFFALCQKAPRASDQYKSLPAPPMSQNERERVQARLAALAYQPNHRLWYETILANPQKYAPISVESARQAMANHKRWHGKAVNEAASAEQV